MEGECVVGCVEGECVVGVCLGSVGGRMWSGSESVYRRSADVYGNGVVWLEITTVVCSRVPAALNAPPPPPPPPPPQCHLHSEVMSAPLMYGCTVCVCVCVCVWVWVCGCGCGCVGVGVGVWVIQ